MSGSILMLLTILLLGCSKSLMDTKITKENYNSLVEKIRGGSDELKILKVDMAIQGAEIVTESKNKSVAEILEGKSFNEHAEKLKDLMEEIDFEGKSKKVVKEFMDMLNSHFLKMD